MSKANLSSIYETLRLALGLPQPRLTLLILAMGLTLAAGSVA
jgi:hypothetical protein